MKGAGDKGPGTGSLVYTAPGVPSENQVRDCRAEGSLELPICKAPLGLPLSNSFQTQKHLGRTQNGKGPCWAEDVTQLVEHLSSRQDTLDLILYTLETGRVLVISSTREGEARVPDVYAYSGLCNDC